MRCLLLVLCLLPNAAARVHLDIDEPTGPVPPLAPLPLDVDVTVDCLSLLPRMTGVGEPVPVELEFEGPQDRLLFSGDRRLLFDASQCATQTEVEAHTTVRVLVLREAPWLVPIFVNVIARLPPSTVAEAAGSTGEGETAFAIVPAAFFLLEATLAQQVTARDHVAEARVELVNYGNVPTKVTVRQSGGTATLLDVEPILLDAPGGNLQHQTLLLRVRPGEARQSTSTFEVVPEYQFNPELQGPPVSLTVAIIEDGWLRNIPAPGLLPLALALAAVAVVRRRP